VNERIHTQVRPEQKASSFAPTRSRLLQRKCACGATPGVDGECAECRSQRLLGSQRPSGSQSGPSEVPPVVHEVLASPGQALDAAARGFMEPRFGHDFSKLRVHTDAKAAESAQAVNALAYTVGHDVVFGAMEYAPQSVEGRRLLAHELAHVVQQQHSGDPTNLTIGPSEGVLEHEADRAASDVAAGEIVARLSTSSTSRSVQRRGGGSVGVVPQPVGTQLPVQPNPNSPKEMYERSQLYGAQRRLGMKGLADPIPTFQSGGSPPDFITKTDRTHKTALLSGREVETPTYQLHVLDAIEYWTEQADNDDDILRVVGIYMPDVLHTLVPGAPPTLGALDPDFISFLDPGGKHRLAAWNRGLEKRKKRLAPKPAPSVTPQQAPSMTPMPEPRKGNKTLTVVKRGARRNQCSKDPSPYPLPIKWPSFLPYPDDPTGLVRTPGDFREDEAMGGRGPEQRRMNDQIVAARRGRVLMPPPRPCDPAVTGDESRWNTPYDAHHRHPLFLGGFDVRDNLCALEADLHQRGHPLLNNQMEFLPDYMEEGICSGYLTHHPALQTYMIVGEK
jgi:hypothetical protein